MIAVDLDFKGLEETEKWLDEIILRSQSFAPVAPRILADLVDQNRGIRFNPGNPSSILEFRPLATFAIGSRRTNYGGLLNASPAFMLDMMVEYLLDGRV